MKTTGCVRALSLALVLCHTAHAALQDEVQVYTDDINALGEHSLEMHVNMTPSASSENSKPSYPGEVINLHGLRVTPEFGYGLTQTVELGLYLPVVRDQHGTTAAAGFKLRAKWLPIQAIEVDGVKQGAFVGTNFEFASVKAKFEKARQALEMRNIVGYRAAAWSFAANPILRWGLTPGYRGQTEFELDARLMHTVGSSSQAGLEYYDVLGRVGHFDAPSQRDRRLFAIWEQELKGGWAVQFGVGRGYGTGDRYTLKSIISVPL